MSIEPNIVDREGRPYVSITSWVPVAALGKRLPPLMGEVFGWLGQRGVPIDGAPIWKYNVIDMSGELEVEVGVPVHGTVAGDGRVQSHVLPAGRYATAQHVGHPDALEQATRELLEWAEREGLAWDVVELAGKQRWTARVEEYLTDPGQQPDMTQWVTNLLFKLAD
jgi:effector-binding domain-containing protein